MAQTARDNSLPFLSRKQAFEWLATGYGRGETFRNLCVWLASHALGETHARWLLGAKRSSYSRWKQAMEQAYRQYGEPILCDPLSQEVQHAQDESRDDAPITAADTEHTANSD